MDEAAKLELEKYINVLLNLVTNSQLENDISPVLVSYLNETLDISRVALVVMDQVLACRNLQKFNEEF